MSKKNKIVIYIILGCCFLCFFISLFSRKRVNENQAYYDRDYIALYIYKYEKLPINFITKDCKSNSYYIGDKSNVYENGYNIGGDNFRYDGSITELTSKTNLKECDYYPNREEVIENNNRGSYRLVYNVYGDTQVFYTEDHYQTFNKLTEFNLNITSNIFRIFSFIFLASDVVYVVLIFKPKFTNLYKKEDNQEIEAEVIE